MNPRGMWRLQVVSNKPSYSLNKHHEHDLNALRVWTFSMGEHKASDK